MSITTNEPGKQQYTALFTDSETKQQNICTYKSSAVLTTDYQALLEYVGTLVHYDRKNTYRIAWVTNCSTEITSEDLRASH